MFLQEFGNDFVLLLELRFQHFDFGQLGILLAFDIGRVRLPLKDDGSVLKQLLLPEKEYTVPLRVFIREK